MKSSKEMSQCLPAVRGGRLGPLVARHGIEPAGDGLVPGQHDGPLPGQRVLLRREGPGVVLAQPEADVDRAGGEDAVGLDVGLVDGAAPHHLARQVVPDGQVGVGLEDDLEVGRLGGGVGVGGEVDELVAGAPQLLVDDAGVEHGVHLGHVGAPGHHRVGQLDVVVAAGRLVDAEGLHEGHHRRGHAVARVGVEVVGAPAGLDQLRRRVALHDGVLARAHHRDPGRPERLVGARPLGLHDVEGLLPGDLLEVPLLVELAPLLPQQRPREPVGAVEDLGAGVALGAEQAAVDRAGRVALHRHHAAGLGGDLDAAAGAAEPADALVPGPALGLGGQHLQWNAGGADDRGGEACFEELPAGELEGHGAAFRAVVPDSGASHAPRSSVRFSWGPDGATRVIDARALSAHPPVGGARSGSSARRLDPVPLHLPLQGGRLQAEASRGAVGAVDLPAAGVEHPLDAAPAPPRRTNRSPAPAPAARRALPRPAGRAAPAPGPARG